MESLSLPYSHVVLSHDFDSEKQALIENIEPEFLRIFDCQELKLEDAHELIAQAYLTSSKTKTLAIFAYSYNHFAQNTLLKILEEPPSQTRFIIHAVARHKLLPTIFSRLVVFDRRNKSLREAFPLDIVNLNLTSIYTYTKELEKQHCSTEQGVELVARLLDSIAKSPLMLNENDLYRFDKAVEALTSKQPAHLVILPLLLSLLPKGG